LKRNKIWISIVVILFVLAGLVALPIIYSISVHLAKTSRAEANVLLVEGWLPPYAVKMAYDEFRENGYEHVFTTGIRISGYFQVSMNGYLKFYTSGPGVSGENRLVNSIEIDAYSELDGDDCAHFNVFVNDSLVGDFYAGTKQRLYKVSWAGELSEIDSVMVQFDNDRRDGDSDRNLYVKEIILNGEIRIPYQHNSVYVFGNPGAETRSENNFNSHAELARNSLLALGIDSALILAIPGERVKVNRTLSSALAFRDWLKTSDIEVKGINIVTSGTHAKRTLMTYNRILKKKYEVGIIALPDYQAQASRRYRVLNTLREIVGLAYYRVILIAY
jgi:hypothetical protein